MASTHYCAKCLTTFLEDPDNCPNLSCGSTKPKKGWGDLLGPGDLLDRHYYIVKPLAVGGAGLTYLAREIDATGEPVPPELAIKVLYTQRDSGPFLRRLSNEAQILQELAHDNIVECRGFVHRAGHAPYLVTKFEHGGSLSGHIEQVGTVPPLVAGGILRQVLLALDIAHQRGVVHRDLKPDNVLLADPVDREVVPHIRVTDFGIAKVFGGVGQRLTRVGAFVGTPEYAAPEQFEGLAPTPATDVFAAGGLLYYLLVGEPPVRFNHRMDIESSYDELLAQIPPRLPTDSEDPSGTAVLQDVLDHVMVAQPGDRWTIQQVLARLAQMGEAAKARPGAKPVRAMTVDGQERILRPDGTLDTKGEETFLSLDAEPSRSAPAARSAVDSRGAAPQARPGTVDSIPYGRTPPPAPERPPAGETPAATGTDGAAAAGPPPPPPPNAPASAEPTAPNTAPTSTRPGATTAPTKAPTTSTTDVRRRRGGGGGAVVGIAGMLVVIGGSSVLALLVVVGAAWGFGWFAPAPAAAAVEPVVLQPVVVQAPEPVDISRAAEPDLVAERDAILDALKKEAVPKVVAECAPKQVIGMDLVVGPDGALKRVALDRGPSAEVQECVTKHLRAATVPRATKAPVKLRASLSFF